ncbi:MAG: hypothetical protein ABIH78_05040, partial [Candidatus Peregrinibacteria bacterium]
MAKRQETTRERTKENERMIAELKGTSQGALIVEQFSHGKLEEKTFRRAYEVSKDPNLMKRDSIKQYIKALSQGKFPKNAKHANRILDAITSGTKKEKDYAEELLKHLSSDSTGQWGEKTEKENLKRLAELRDEDLQEEAIKGTSSAAAAVTSTAEIHEELEKTSHVERENWEMMQPPKELIERLRAFDSKHYELAKSVEEKDANLQSMEKTDTAKKAELEKKIDTLRREMAKIDEEINALREENEENEEKYTIYLKKALAGYRGLKEFSMAAGLDMEKVAAVTMWFLEPEPDEAHLPSIKGLEINAETGETGKEKTILKIERIYFDDSNPDADTDAAGQIVIEYLNENGEKVTSGLRNFLNMIKVYEGYEEIDTMEEFSKKFGIETSFQEIHEGDTFTRSVLTGFENEKPVYAPETITIEKLEKRDGKYMVILDRTVMKTPKAILPSSIHDSLYFDRMQKEFSLGEFGTFLRKKGFQRDVADNEMQEVVSAVSKNFKVPEGEEKTNVRYIDKFRRSYDATVKQENEGYEVELLTGTDGQRWGMPVIPPALVGLPPSPPRPKPTTPKFRKLNKRDFLQALNKGDVQDSKSAEMDMGMDLTPAQEPSDRQAMSKQEPLPPTKSSEEGDITNLDQWKPKFYKEALPYKDIYKAGGMSKVERGFLRTMWVKTRFLSGSDLWEMGKTMWEYYKRRYERRQKDKYSSIGKSLPFFSPEMQRINQATETEQMNQFKESFDQKGVFEIQERLQKTHVRDELKAAMATLCEKGQMRWDDLEVWKNINRFIDPSLAIPIPSNGDPNTRVSDKDDRTGFDYLKAAIDSMWGDGQYNDWYA